jgi:hypothetical protein
MVERVEAIGCVHQPCTCNRLAGRTLNSAAQQHVLGELNPMRDGHASVAGHHPVDQAGKLKSSPANTLVSACKLCGICANASLALAA